MSETEPPNGMTLRYRVGELEKDVQMLAGKVDRLMWALVGLSLSIAGASITLVLTAVQ